MAKMYDTSKFMNILTAKSDTAKNDRLIYSAKVQRTNESPNLGRFKYTPEGSKSRYRNQGYSGEDLYSVDQREESYNKWKDGNNQVNKQQRDQSASTEIGDVSSSWLTSLGYSTNTNEAIATFHGVNATFYYKMSYETFLNWLNAPSKGKWLHDHPSIMHNYTVKGGGTKTNFEGRMKGLYKTRNSNRMGSDGTKQAKARVRQYLEKWR